MNQIMNQRSFFAASAAPYRGQFEKPDISGNGSLCAQFGGRLRRVFELPCAESAPDDFAVLLRRIEEKLDAKKGGVL